MLPYGSTKRGSAKIHPHNECSICSENSIEKNTARKEAEKEIQEQLNSNLFDLWGCGDDCPYCGDWLGDDCTSPLCGCEDCNHRSLNEGKGWKKC